MKTVYSFPVVLLGFVAFSHTVQAHAFLSHATPPVGSKVHGSPEVVRLQFTERIEPAFSNVQVFDETGREVDKGDKHGDKTDGAVLEVTVPSLKPGRYKVVWRALSVDTHTTHGDFTFQVSP
jgi:methionine-rich copper-binding protein CopC